MPIVWNFDLDVLTFFLPLSSKTVNLFSNLLITLLVSNVITDFSYGKFCLVVAKDRLFGSDKIF